MTIKKIILACALLVPAMALAQPRFAVFNSTQVFDAMPEKAAAEDSLKALSARYHDEVKLMQDQFNSKFADFQSLEAAGTMPAAIRERRMRELRDEDQKIEQFERAAAADIDRQRQELTRPIHALIEDAVRTVGETEGFTMIFDTARTPVAYRDANTPDVTHLVKQQLHIK